MTVATAVEQKLPVLAFFTDMIRIAIIALSAVADGVDYPFMTFRHRATEFCLVGRAVKLHYIGHVTHC